MEDDLFPITCQSLEVQATRTEHGKAILDVHSTCVGLISIFRVKTQF